MKKILLRIAGFLLLLALISQILSGCLSFRMSSKEIDDYFKEKQLSYQLDTFPFKDYSIHYISTDNDSLPLVIFVHGSPGSLSSFIEFAGDKTLRKNVSMISIDRPGYGESNYGKSMESLKEQAKCIQTLVNQKSKNRSVILVGHSLGGPIIATVAMEYPDLVQGLIFVGASVSAELEPEENWFRYPLYTPLLRWVLPKSFRVTNDEIYKLKPQLEKMEDDWKSITIPVAIIQGGKDRLVDPGNVEFLLNHLTNTTPKVYFKEDINHFIPWSNPELINQAILDMIKQVE